MGVVVTTGAQRRAKLQSYHHHQQTNTQLFTGWMPFLSPLNNIESRLSLYIRFEQLTVANTVSFLDQHQDNGLQDCGH